MLTPPPPSVRVSSDISEASSNSACARASRIPPCPAADSGGGSGEGKGGGGMGGGGDAVGPFALGAASAFGLLAPGACAVLGPVRLSPAAAAPVSIGAGAICIGGASMLCNVGWSVRPPLPLPRLACRRGALASGSGTTAPVKMSNSRSSSMGCSTVSPTAGGALAERCIGWTPCGGGAVATALARPTAAARARSGAAGACDSGTSPNSSRGGSSARRPVAAD